MTPWLLCATLATAAPTSGPVLNGAVSTELVGYPQVGDAAQSIFYGVLLDASLHARPWKSVLLKVAPRFRWDFVDSSRNRVIPREAWLIVLGGPVAIKAGLHRFHWGVSTLYRPTDPLNQLDYGTGFYRTEKLGEPAVSTTFELDPVTIELAWLPVFQHPHYPGGDDVLGIQLGRLGALAVDLDEGFTDDIRLETMTFAARVSATLGPVDAELTWMSGPSRLPGPWLDDLTMRSVTYPVDVLGGSLLWALDPVMLRGEIAWVGSTRRQDFVVPQNPFPWTEPIPDSYAAYVLGAELTLWDLVGDHDLTIEVEYLGEIREFLDAQSTFRPWQDDLFVSLRWRFDDLDDTVLSAAAAIDLGRHDTLLRFSAARHLGWDITLHLDANVIVEGDEGPISLLHTLADRDSLAATLEWSF